MTLVFFSLSRRPVGRTECCACKTSGRAPALVTWQGRTFAWEETTSMGWHNYLEVTHLALQRDEMRLAPATAEK